MVNYKRLKEELNNEFKEELNIKKLIIDVMKKFDVKMSQLNSILEDVKSDYDEDYAGITERDIVEIIDAGGYENNPETLSS